MSKLRAIAEPDIRTRELYVSKDCAWIIEAED